VTKQTVIIDGKGIAATVRAQVAERVADYRERTGRVPGLATVLVGDDPASAVYIANKRRLAAAVGIADLHRHLVADSTHADIAKVLDELAADDEVDGILLQLPLPNSRDAGPLIARIPTAKDVDGLTTLSAGLLAQGEPGLRPCTPSGVMRILAESGVDLAGKRAVVIGRSGLVGRPISMLLMQADATVTIAHSRSLNLPALCREADVLVVAAGVPGLIGAAHVSQGAVVIDVGIHRTESGLVGDVRFDKVSGVASMITPVPGGVGPMTIAMLLSNTMQAAERRWEATSVGESNAVM
jgi:methylenetetrahydrofolate dehydrogenase (NADP+)/methenyltetrahydrofolate cyclohydrolase